MFKKAKPQAVSNASKTVKQRESIPTIITHDIHILGNIVSDGAVDFSGNIDGNIKCDTLSLREGGTVKGEITANSVFIQGTVKGLIRAKNVNLLASCKVEGIIIHEGLSIEEGAFVDGKFKRSDRMTLQDEASNEENDGGFDANLPSMTRAGSSATASKMLENIRLIR